MYALIIQDENGSTVVEHVAVNGNDPVITDHEELPNNQWGRPFYLTFWVSKNRPDWKIYEAQFSVRIRDEKISIDLV